MIFKILIFLLISNNVNTSSVTDDLVQSIIEEILNQIIADSLSPSETEVTSDSTSGSKNVEDWFKPNEWDVLFPYMDYILCNNSGRFTYDAFITAAKKWRSKGFLNSGDHEKDRRELAAFFGQTSHETTGGGGTWTYDLPGSPSPFEFGYCFWDELNGHLSPYCAVDPTYPCEPGKWYSGRGPLQLSYNYNYGQFGDAIGRPEILKRPELLDEDPSLAFEGAMWFWMTPQYLKPSCHDVIDDIVTTSQTNGKPLGFGLLTVIINGGECHWASGNESEFSSDRIGFYKRYLEYFGVSDSREMGCKDIRPY
ncbi:hypothetical protein MHBO_001029 [Bonamia ostreae]|uniref:Glycoside hydrolase family 19 catalytic domain-containing protein n=1 Tax=Bonamia ostreae TaxID=126728 RepID=A0ABV2AHM4_9EUKA